MVILKEFKKRIYSRLVIIGLQRDLYNEFQAQSAKIKIQTRLMRKEDVAELLDETADSSINPRIIANQLSMVNANIPTCYVAVTAKNKPCYMQCLLSMMTIIKYRCLITLQKSIITLDIGASE